MDEGYMTADQMFASIGYDKAETLEGGVKMYSYSHFPGGLFAIYINKDGEVVKHDQLMTELCGFTAAEIRCVYQYLHENGLV